MNKENLIKEYNNIIDEIDNEIENLKYLLDNIDIDNINLINIHYKFNDLLNKKKDIKNKLYIEYNYMIYND